MAGQIFKNLGKFMSYEEKQVSKSMPNKIMIKYTQPKYQDPKKVWEVGVFEDKISEALLEKIVALSSGEEVCVHTMKNEKGFADLHDITEAKDAAYNGGGGKTAYKSGGYTNNYTPKDDTGIAVGAAWTNALEYYKVTDEKPKSLEEVATVVEQILKLKLAQEDKLRAAKTAKTEVETKKAEVKAPSKLEQMKAKKSSKPTVVVEETLDSDDSLDEIDFEGDV